MSPQRKRQCLTRAELRAMGATPGRLSTHYSPDGRRATVRQVVGEDAERRVTGDLMARYFDEIDPEARALYAEFSELRTEEALDGSSSYARNTRAARGARDVTCTPRTSGTGRTGRPPKG